MIVRKLFDRRPIFHTLSDKLLVRNFIADRIGSRHLPGLLQICDRFEDIDFDGLPDKFVIKPNHGCRFIVLVDDKKKLDRAATRRRIRRWVRTDYYVMSREWFYKGIKRKILIEELLEETSGAPIIDYRFWVFDGVPRLCQVSCRQSTQGERTSAFYDMSCRRLPMRLILPSGPSGPIGDESLPGANFAFPPNTDEMIDIAARLGQGFDFIRVDLYDPGDKVLVGEMTSMSGGGVRPFDPPAYERLFGDYWKQVLS